MYRSIASRLAVRGGEGRGGKGRGGRGGEGREGERREYNAM